MSGSVRVFPRHRLPSRFLLHLDDPPVPPADPEPSATLILLREGRGGMEVLLLERNPRSGFIPGAWVFPGGRVDPGDGDPALLGRITGLEAEEAQRRLTPRDSEPPALAYWVAAIRETFEETGVLLHGKGEHTVPEAIHRARSSLLAEERGFGELLEALGLTLDAGALKYSGYWLTPECEPRRYETRFFTAEVRGDVHVDPHEKEMVDFLWLTPGEALSRNRDGALPLVFPTLFTLEELEAFGSPGAALEALERRPVPRRLPRLRRTPGGIALHFAP